MKSVPKVKPLKTNNKKGKNKVCLLWKICFHVY
jgi:hypothetical protein